MEIKAHKDGSTTRGEKEEITIKFTFKFEFALRLRVEKGIVERGYGPLERMDS